MSNQNEKGIQIKMPFSFPFMRFPYSNYNRYYQYYTNDYHKQNEYANSEPKKNCDNNYQKNNSITKNSSNTISNIFSFLPTSIGPLTFHPEGFTNIESPLFDLFGIKLFLDDIIIIGLLIFLYTEQVDDQLLYIALFLLLIG